MRVFLAIAVTLGLIGLRPAVAQAPHEQLVVGLFPADMATDDTARTLYVALESGGISSVDLRTHEIRQSWGPEYPTWDVAVDDNRNNVWAIHRRSSARSSSLISVIHQPTGRTIETFPAPGGPTAIGFDPSSDAAYVANFDSATVSVIDAQTFDITAKFGGSRWRDGTIGRPMDVVVNKRTRTVFVGTTGGYLLKFRSGALVDRKRIVWRDDYPQLTLDVRRNLVYAISSAGRFVTAVNGDSLASVTKLRFKEVPFDLAVDTRLRLLAVLLDSNHDGTMYVRTFDLVTGKPEANFDAGMGAWDVLTRPGSWKFFVSDSLGDTLIVVPGEDEPPVTSLDRNPTVMDSNGSVSGLTIDRRSGISSVKVLFQGSLNTHEGKIVMECTSLKRCRWSSTVPQIPGTYEVRVEARDRAGNLGQSIPTRIFVTP